MLTVKHFIKSIKLLFYTYNVYIINNKYRGVVLYQHLEDNIRYFFMTKTVIIFILSIYLYIQLLWKLNYKNKSKYQRKLIFLRV